MSDNLQLYAVCPAHYATGGTELLHQFVRACIDLHYDASILYVNIEPGKKIVADAFEQYGIPFHTDFPTDGNPVIILPEVFTDYILAHSEYKYIIWWLSIDNYLKGFNAPTIGMKNNGSFLSRLKYVLRSPIYHERMRKATFEGKQYYSFYKPDALNIIEHWAQSLYATHFLLNHGKTNVYAVGDYLNDSFLQATLERPQDGPRKNIVLYNPRKGWRFTDRLIASAPEIQWVPLQNLTRNEIIELFYQAKVYIDFGEHPGRDRMPREAAACGTCIITGLDGSAGYDADIHIPPRYKFKKRTTALPQITRTIAEIFDDYPTHSRDFQQYRQSLLLEKDRFYDDVAFRLKALAGSNPKPASALQSQPSAIS